MADVNRQLLTLFGEALECASPEEQAAYLDRSCRDDPDLRGRLGAPPQFGRRLDFPMKSTVRWWRKAGNA